MKKRPLMSYDPSAFRKPVDFGPSVTVPAQAMSIRTLFDKYRVAGQIPGAMVREGHDQGISDDQDPEDLLDLEKVRQADDFDREEIRKAAEADLKMKRQKADAMSRAAEAKKAEKQKELDEAVKYAREQKAKSDADNKRAADARKE